MLLIHYLFIVEEAEENAMTVFLCVVCFVCFELFIQCNLQLERFARVLMMCPTLLCLQQRAFFDSLFYLLLFEFALAGIDVLPRHTYGFSLTRPTIVVVVCVVVYFYVE